ncbi:MAG: hypothetical protein ACLFN8_05260 [Candidatus Woesearchaeota archaeon]
MNKIKNYTLALLHTIVMSTGCNYHTENNKTSEEIIPPLVNINLEEAQLHPQKNEQNTPDFYTSVFITPDTLHIYKEKTLNLYDDQGNIRNTYTNKLSNETIEFLIQDYSNTFEQRLGKKEINIIEEPQIFNYTSTKK